MSQEEATNKINASGYLSEIPFVSFECNKLDGKYSLIGCSRVMYACMHAASWAECQLVLIALQHWLVQFDSLVRGVQAVGDLSSWHEQLSHSRQQWQVH